jgi:hypothetical protein
LVDLTEAQVERGMEIIREMLDQGVKRKIFRPEQAEAILGRIQATTRWEDLAEVDCVIEAVFESLDVKKDVFQRLAKVTKPTCILGTNTSSFFVKDVAAFSLSREATEDAVFGFVAVNVADPAGHGFAVENRHEVALVVSGVGCEDAECVGEEGEEGEEGEGNEKGEGGKGGGTGGPGDDGEDGETAEGNPGEEGGDGESGAPGESGGQGEDGTYGIHATDGLEPYGYAINQWGNLQQLIDSAGGDLQDILVPLGDQNNLGYNELQTISFKNITILM